MYPRHELALYVQDAGEDDNLLSRLGQSSLGCSNSKWRFQESACGQFCQTTGTTQFLEVKRLPESRRLRFDDLKPRLLLLCFVDIILRNECRRLTCTPRFSTHLPEVPKKLRCHHEATRRLRFSEDSCRRRIAHWACGFTRRIKTSRGLPTAAGKRRSPTPSHLCCHRCAEPV